MRIDVALLPSWVERPDEHVCVVVDALRATSAITTMLAGGAIEVAVAASIDEARRLKAGPLADRLLCGEAGGLPPEGFDYGNSPAEFSRLNLHGQRVILATSNGTRALVHAAAAPAVFAGSLLNCTAVARAAAREGTRLGIDLVFVCAGTDLSRSFSLEDTAVCGALVEAAVSTYDGQVSELSLTDTAMAAYRVWRSYPSPRLMFGEAVHGQLLARLGLAADLDFCAQTDRYDIVPRLTRGEEGALRLTPA